MFNSGKPTYSSLQDIFGAIYVFKHTLNSKGNVCLLNVKRQMSLFVADQLCLLPKVKLESLRKVFFFQGPVIYNRLPASIRQINTFESFRTASNNF